MRTLSLVALALCVAAAAACQPPNCDHVDYGTCGNACCNLTFTTQANLPTDAAAKLLLETLSKGGPDGRYKLSMTAEGSLGFADFTGYDLPINYLGQAIHHTKVHHYNDTINIAIAPNADNSSSIVTAFSISQIAGAYGDAGQSFKNLIQIFQNTEGVEWTYKIVAGCPAPSNPEPIARLTEAKPEPVPEPLSLHASCRLTWTMPNANCQQTSSALAQAVESMHSLSNCVGEKCGYTLEGANATGLAAYHVTPVHHYRDDISMQFSDNGSGGCVAHCYSTSTIWYAVFDDGTNYCNLHNLVLASGLDYSEDVDTSDCTQYASANCNKY